MTAIAEPRTDPDAPVPTPVLRNFIGGRWVDARTEHKKDDDDPLVLAPRADGRATVLGAR